MAKKEKTSMEIFQDILRKFSSFFSGYMAIYGMHIATGGSDMYNGLRTYGDIGFEFTMKEQEDAMLAAINEIYGEIKKREEVQKYPVEKSDVVALYNVKSIRALLTMIDDLTTNGKLELKKLVRLCVDLDDNIIDVSHVFPEIVDIVNAAKSDDDTVRLSELHENLKFAGKEKYMKRLELDAKGIPKSYIPSDKNKMIDILYLWLNRSMDVNAPVDIAECKQIQKNLIDAILERESKTWLSLTDIPLADKMLYKKNHLMTFKMSVLTGNEDDDCWASICKGMFPYITEKTMDKVKLYTEYQYHNIDTYAIYVKYNIPGFHVYGAYYEMPSKLPVSMDWENLKK